MFKKFAGGFVLGFLTAVALFVVWLFYPVFKDLLTAQEKPDASKVWNEYLSSLETTRSEVDFLEEVNKEPEYFYLSRCGDSEYQKDKQKRQVEMESKASNERGLSQEAAQRKIDSAVSILRQAPPIAPLLSLLNQGLSIRFSDISDIDTGGEYHRDKRLILISKGYMVPEEKSDETVAAILAHEFQHAWDHWDGNPLLGMELELRAFNTAFKFIDTLPPHRIPENSRRTYKAWKDWDWSDLKQMIEYRYCAHFPGQYFESDGDSGKIPIPRVVSKQPPYNEGKALWSFRNIKKKGVVTSLIFTDGGSGIAAVGTIQGKDKSGDFWIKKFDLEGRQKWTLSWKLKKGLFEAVDRILEGTDGSLYAVGKSGNDPWMAKISGDGRKIWEKTFKDCESGSLSAMTEIGGLLIAGGYGENCGEDKINQKGLLRLVSPDGNPVEDLLSPRWNLLDKSEHREIFSLRARGNTLYIAANVYHSTQAYSSAQWVSRLNLETQEMREKIIPGKVLGQAMDVDSKGLIWIAGTRLIEGQSSSALIQKIDLDDEAAPVRAVIHDQGTSYGANVWNDITVDDSGKVHVAGHTRLPLRSLDVWVRGYHPEGNLLYSLGYDDEDSNWDSAYAVIKKEGMVCAGGRETVRLIGTTPWITCWKI